MIDYGLLVSMIIAFGVPSLVGSWWMVSGRDGPVGFLDVALGPAFAGLAVGRLTTLALDDPSSIGSISDMLIIRSGVEFWPGVAAAVAAVLVSAHLGLVSPSQRMAELAPLAMIGYAGYEAACIFRDGCFGPASAIGLRPPGLATTMLPVGWFMAAAVGVAALGVHTLVARGRPPLVVGLASVAAVASVRAVGSIWLPHVGDGLTRQHLSSIVVAVASLAGVAAVAVASDRRNGSEDGHRHYPRKAG
jgi:hypothetical protein